MRIFIYEYASAQPAETDLPSSIRREGRAMLDAICGDFRRLSEVEVATLSPGDNDDPLAFQKLAASADWSLVIAPEFDGLLTTRCQWVERAGGRLLGPSSSAVEFLSDKWNLYRTLTAWGVPTPETSLVGTCEKQGVPSGGSDSGQAPGRQGDAPTTFVVKPRWGAGSVGVRRLGDPVRDAVSGAMLRQSFVPGIPASCAVLLSPKGQAIRFPAAWQFLGGDTGFRYLGGEVPLDASLDRRVARLLGPLLPRLARLPGLKGYVGIDLILGDDPDGGRDAVIEINPRLTTSYLGLRKLARGNLAEAMLAVAQGRSPDEFTWKPGRVRFGAEGVTAVSDASGAQDQVTQRHCPRH